MSQSVNIRDREKFDKAEIGFWLYLMTDVILFASLFATFMVLRSNTAGGPDGAEIFDPQFALIQTVILLTSSLTCGLAVLSYKFAHTKRTIGFLLMTIGLGAAFLSLELYEFSALVAEGFSWQRSAFLSSFFTLVGTHGLHILFGLIWAILMVVYLLRTGLTINGLRKLTLFSLFWHFLDLVWIFVFSVVYLIGGIS